MNGIKLQVTEDCVLLKEVFVPAFKRNLKGYAKQISNHVRGSDELAAEKKEVAAAAAKRAADAKARGEKASAKPSKQPRFYEQKGAAPGKKKAYEQLAKEQAAAAEKRAAAVAKAAAAKKEKEKGKESYVEPTERQKKHEKLVEAAEIAACSIKFDFKFKAPDADGPALLEAEWPVQRGMDKTAEPKYVIVKSDYSLEICQPFVPPAERKSGKVTSFKNFTLKQETRINASESDKEVPPVQVLVLVHPINPKRYNVELQVGDAELAQWKKVLTECTQKGPNPLGYDALFVPTFIEAFNAVLSINGMPHLNDKASANSAGELMSESIHKLISDSQGLEARFERIEAKVSRETHIEREERVERTFLHIRHHR
jgi:hypothetical protein